VTGKVKNKMYHGIVDAISLLTHEKNLNTKTFFREIFRLEKSKKFSEICQNMINSSWPDIG
jgi:hypothetical protein